MNIQLRHARFTGYLLLAVAVIALDQLSKQAALIYLPGRAVEVLPVFHLALVFNRGAAFGFLAGAGGWQQYFLAGVAVVFSVVLVGWLWRVCARASAGGEGGGALLCWGLALVLGGALGNLADRMIQQAVVDFIVLHYRGWVFPAFNLADSAITLGAVAFIADNLGWWRRRDRL